MEYDDKVRSNLGVAVCLRDMGNGTSRIFFDDVKADETQNPITWQFDCFYTFTPELDNSSLDELGLTDEQLQQIGWAVVARLLALNKRIR